MNKPPRVAKKSESKSSDTAISLLKKVQKRFAKFKKEFAHAEIAVGEEKLRAQLTAKDQRIQELEEEVRKLKEAQGK